MGNEQQPLPDETLDILGLKFTRRDVIKALLLVSLGGGLAVFARQKNGCRGDRVEPCTEITGTYVGFANGDEYVVPIPTSFQVASFVCPNIGEQATSKCPDSAKIVYKGPNIHTYYKEGVLVPGTCSALK